MSTPATAEANRARLAELLTVMSPTAKDEVGDRNSFSTESGLDILVARECHNSKVYIHVSISMYDENKVVASMKEAGEQCLKWFMELETQKLFGYHTLLIEQGFVTTAVRDGKIVYHWMYDDV